MSLISTFMGTRKATYEELEEKLELRDEVFKTHKIEMSDLKKSCEREVQDAKDAAADSIKIAARSNAEKIAALESTIRVLKADLDTSIVLGVKEAVATLEKENNKLTLAHDVMAAKLGMYEGAFAELGLDVKDTKEIISDLIKALGVKSQVQVIK